MRRVGVCGAVLIGVLAFPSWAVAHESNAGGGVSIQAPDARQFVCDDGRVAACGRRQSMTIRGEWLATTRTVSFLGRTGAKDDRDASVIARDEHSLVVLVPSSARSGPIRVKAPTGVSTGNRVRVTKTAEASNTDADVMYIDGQSMRFDYSASAGSTIELVRIGDLAPVSSWLAKPDTSGRGQIVWDGRLGSRDAPNGRYGFRVVQTDGTAGAVAKTFSIFDHIFPIRGKHDLGQGPINNFGGGRGHQGQDMFAACGTSLVAARGGVVIKATFQSRAGNYVVIKRPDGQSYAYMHMRQRALVREGQRVATGQKIGEVGETGRASGCHLHFELWSTPGWYLGGKPVDPLPQLKAWDSWS